MDIKLSLLAGAFVVIIYLLITASSISMNAEVSKESNRFSIELQR